MFARGKLSAVTAGEALPRGSRQVADIRLAYGGGELKFDAGKFKRGADHEDEPKTGDDRQEDDAGVRHNIEENAACTIHVINPSEDRIARTRSHNLQV